jgi:malonate transporter
VSNPLLLLPDLLLILLGWLLCRRTSLDRPLWDAVERLVYHLLFPVLLINSIVRSPLQPAQVASLAAAALGTLAAGVALALALGCWPGVDRRLHASGAQTAYRFNSYIALALSGAAGRRAGACLDGARHRALRADLQCRRGLAPDLRRHATHAAARPASHRLRMTGKRRDCIFCTDAVLSSTRLACGMSRR